jgi:4-hydroxy-2-oxoheptanedioate aldolase
MPEALDVHGPDRFADRLRRRQTVLGTVLTLPSVALAELAADSVDFVWIDLEHGALGTADVQPLAVAARAAGCAALVRLPGPDPARLFAILDAGVHGVVAPAVESAEHARRLVDRLHHPPRGSRGFAARRASAYGRAALAPGDPICVAQIESAAGLEAAEQIAAVDGVDALVVGCADLALALGGTLELRSERVRTAIERVQLAARLAGIASGIAGPGDARLLAQLGAGESTVFVLAADVRLYARGVDEGIARLRAELAPAGEAARGA